jgi:hypothetical protein
MLFIMDAFLSQMLFKTKKVLWLCCDHFHIKIDEWGDA